MRETFGVAGAEESLVIKPFVLQRPQIPETCEPHLAEMMKQCWQDDPKVDLPFTALHTHNFSVQYP